MIVNNLDNQRKSLRKLDENEVDVNWVGRIFTDALPFLISKLNCDFGFFDVILMFGKAMLSGFFTEFLEEREKAADRTVEYC